MELLVSVFYYILSEVNTLKLIYIIAMLTHMKTILIDMNTINNLSTEPL